MQPLDSINIKVETISENLETGNVTPILHQIRHAIEQLLAQNDTMTIDLNAMPFAPGEKDQLQAILGEGEIKAQLNALGKSEIYETQYASVWWVAHYNSNDNLMGQFIEITWLPEILRSQAEDVGHALSQLTTLCKTTQ